MKREIKFRGIMKHCFQWVYGSLVKYPNGNVAICDSGGSVFEVYDFTVGQYTGVEDRNGKEIYEGDIVRIWKHCGLTDSTVIFERGAFIAGYFELTNCNDVPILLHPSAEVVGNTQEKRKLAK